MTNQIIEVKNLHKYYPRPLSLIEFFSRLGLKRQQQPALKDISFQIKGPQIVGLMGKNGSGKTTLIKTLATLLYPEQGSIFINGKNVIKNEKKLKNIVGYVNGNERSFFWRLTVKENLEFFGSLYGIKEDLLEVRIEEVLVLVDLYNERNKRFDKLSLGMRQRLAIARSLISKPKIILFDEPTSGLDPVLAENLRKKLTKIKTAGTLILLATHNDKDLSICDKLLVLNKGRLVYDGSVTSAKRIGLKRILEK